MADLTPRGIALDVLPWLALVAFLAAGLFAVAKVSAREMPADDKAALAATIDRFNNAMRQKDYDTVVATSLPRAIIAQIASAYGLKDADLETFQASIRAQMVGTLKVVELVDFGMDQKAIAYHELADGSFYAMVPTETVMQSDAKKYRARSQTLAVKDNGVWYLLRVSGEQQGAMVRAAYPQLKDVQFSDSQMEEIGQ
jgi:hypothetical protein